MSQVIEMQGENGENPTVAAPVRFEGVNSAALDLRERIRSAVQNAGGYSAVADKPGLPGRTLSRLLAGQEPKMSHVVDLASATSVRIEWLVTGTGPMHASERIVGQDVAMPPGQALAVPAGTVLIDRHDARAAAGRNGVLSDTAVIERVLFSEAWVRRVLRRNPGNLALLEAFGDSMEPTIADGDVIMIDVVVDDLVSGRIYVVDLSGELLVKRIQRRVNGSLLVLSDNPRYPPEEVSAADAHHLRLVGEVVWHAHAV